MINIIEVTNGPWSVGMDNVSADTALVGTQQDSQGNIKLAAVRDALNGQFDREGYFHRRPSLQLIQAGSDIHSLWTSEVTGQSYVAQGNTLYRLSYDGVDMVTVPLAAVPGSPLSYCDFNGDVYFTSPGILGVVHNTGVAEKVGVETPNGVSASAIGIGGLRPGRYGVAATYLTATNEESGLSPITIVEVPEGGGIQVTAPLATEGKATRARIYLTAANGDTLCSCVDVSPGSSGSLGNNTLGRPADTWQLTRMQGGSIVRGWRGRLWVADGAILRYSEAMRYGLTSLRHNFIYLATPITLLEPVEGGLYIGSSEGVWFLAGTAAENWTLQRTSGKPPLAGSGTTLPANLLNSELAQMGTRYALWLSEVGFVLGTADGHLIEIQKDRLKLNLTGKVSNTAVVDRTVFTLIH